ncbi:response regulator [Vibrio tapetis]|uniref:Response regulator/GGDEF domain protein n=1 Tax=Vibrio tapetis subsp. tapetis TaxID=1671868 RepID=A0A2N8ZA72_9VIBR|nr:response regulator [Vibrio tapetis]SON48819.1 Response regulator/GGDEF domain protein [Vibrio tapetis subsp. tapetis]
MKEMLVVEDNNSIATVIQQIGQSLKYKVTVAKSLAEVKEILAVKTDFFVATIDYSLPDAYEGQAISYILRHDIPSIVVTGRVSDKIHQELLKLPIIDYVTKENSQAYFYLQRVLHSQLTNHKIGVLVVDDSLSVRSYVSALLERRNFTLYSQPDGKKALQAIKDNSDIKLVITDYDMPGMNGIDVVQAIRRLFTEREIIIIGYSASSKSYQSARFIKSGADDYLHKPFCPEEFYCRVFKNVERLQYIENIKTASVIDYLTSLPNRDHFIEVTDKQLDFIEMNKLTYLLVVFHIDHFKRINDKHSFSAGDQILISMSSLLKERFKAATLARFYGAEFGCLISGTDIAKVKSALTDFMSDVKKQSIAVDSDHINFSVSIGATVVKKQSSIKLCIEQADAALQQAQQGGENQIHIDTKSGQPSSKEEVI